MMRLFFVGIPSLLFEPIAVVALLGCITTFCFFHKKNNSFFWITTAAICFMFVWRLSYYTLMLSTRYAAIILYPAIIFAVLFCFHVRDAVQYIIRKFPYLGNSFFGKIYQIIPYFLISVLIVASIAKTLHHNPYKSYSVKLCKTLANEIKGKDFLLYVQDERERISYYTGVDIKKIEYLPAKKQNLLHIIKNAKNYLENIYVIFFLKQGDSELDAASIGIEPEIGKWECIHREFTSRKKNKEMLLYRFIPAHPNIEIWEKKIPDISPNNLCKNGIFEQSLSPKDQKRRIVYYNKIGLSDFYLNEKRLFPAQWNLEIRKSTKAKSPEIALTDKSPIAGKYSLEMKSNSNLAWRINNNFIPKQDGTFSGFIRAGSESSVTILSCYWNIDKQRTNRINSYSFRLLPGKTYRFSFPVRMDDVPKNDKYIFLIIGGHGHILLDNVEFISNKKTTGTEPKQ